jgi:hypothetical protein
MLSSEYRRFIIEDLQGFEMGRWYLMVTANASGA